MSLTRPTLLSPEYGMPLFVTLRDDSSIGIRTGCVGAQHFNLLGVVAREEGGVDLDAAHDAGGGSESDRHVIGWVGIVSSCFPAVVPMLKILRDPFSWLSFFLSFLFSFLPDGNSLDMMKVVADGPTKRRFPQRHQGVRLEGWD